MHGLFSTKTACIPHNMNISTTGHLYVKLVSSLQKTPRGCKQYYMVAIQPSEKLEGSCARPPFFPRPFLLHAQLLIQRPECLASVQAAAYWLREFDVPLVQRFLLLKITLAGGGGRSKPHCDCSSHLPLALCE